MTVDARPDYYRPGQAPRLVVIARETDVLHACDTLAEFEPSPTKRGQIAQRWGFLKWQYRRGLLNDGERQP